MPILKIPAISEERLEQCRQTMFHGIPHAQALGMKLIFLKAGKAEISLPWREDLVGNPLTGVFHGGVITSLLDNTCGMAVSACYTQPTSLVTLDLRIDYARSAHMGQTIIAQAECYCLTKSVAFVRGIAFDDDITHPVASCMATFMPVDSSE
jgi:uncharacterized protein (TIGR00369 family)